MSSEPRAALDSYHALLAQLTAAGRAQSSPAVVAPPFFQHLHGMEQLLISMAAVAPAVPGARDEEWNPLSQRPHAPLPPAVGHELGGEITALKEAVDAFTTLAHEVLHVALWEPFFAGVWRPRGKSAFRKFALMAEGFCFFYSDIVISERVRVRLPDGEFALDRQSPSNARFAPCRAFKALGITDASAVLAIYLEGFCGERTALWQPRGTSDVAAALAVQVYDFYHQTLPYLDEVEGALRAFGVMTEFYRRFCALRGLPTLLDRDAGQQAGRAPASYFQTFFKGGMQQIASLSPAVLAGVRWRRKLQMRAYYALQVRWLLEQQLVVGPGLTRRLCERLKKQVVDYLAGLEGLLKLLAKGAGEALAAPLAQLDGVYDVEVRRLFQAHDAWVGQRWLIAPRRAGGMIGTGEAPPEEPHAAKVRLLQVVAYLVDELTWRMRRSKTVADRTAVLAQLQRVAALGADCGSVAKVRKALRLLRSELSHPEKLPLWSLPMAAFDPVHNSYRELLFSYQ